MNNTYKYIKFKYHMAQQVPKQYGGDIHDELLDILKGYVGLYTVTNWKVNDKQYLKQCDESCTDDVCKNLFEQQKNITFRDSQIHPKIGNKTDNCILWEGSNGYYCSPKKCVETFTVGSIIKNRYNNHDYQMIKNIKCVMYCKSFSYIFNKVGTNDYYFLFGPGAPQEKDKTNKINILINSALFLWNI